MEFGAKWCRFGCGVGIGAEFGGGGREECNWGGGLGQNFGGGEAEFGGGLRGKGKRVGVGGLEFGAKRRRFGCSDSNLDPFPPPPFDPPPICHRTSRQPRRRCSFPSPKTGRVWGSLFTSPKRPWGGGRCCPTSFAKDALCSSILGRETPCAPRPPPGSSSSTACPPSSG